MEISKVLVAMILLRSLYILECGLVSIGKLTYQKICTLSCVKCVFGKGKRESQSSNPPTKKWKTVVHNALKSTARFGNQATTKSELAFETKQVYVSVLILLGLHYSG